ncbi:MAG: TerD family protein [Patescibacteria group bacterium]
MAMSVEVKKGKGLSIATKQLAVGINAGLSWDPAVSGVKSDLDLFAAAATFNPNDNVYYLETMASLLYHSNLEAFGGAMKHSGDEQAGSKEGDDESIIAFLNKLPNTITDVIIGVCVDPIKSPGKTFKDIRNGQLKIYKVTEGQQATEEVCHVNLTDSSAKGILVGKFFRTDSGWDFHNIQQEIVCTSNTPILEVLEAVPCDSLG